MKLEKLESYSPMERELYREAYNEGAEYVDNLMEDRKIGNETHRILVRMGRLSHRGEHIYIIGYQEALNDSKKHLTHEQINKLEKNLP